jgi:hypothetical protein
MEQSPRLTDPVAPAPDEAAGWTAARRSGYLISALINLLLLWVAHNLLDWDVLPFLTESFNDVLPAITVSLVVTVIVNLFRVINPDKRFVAITEVLILIVNLYATVAVWRVFPFEFDDDGIPWDLAFRAFLLLAIVGTAIGIVAQVIKTLRLATVVR